MMNEITAILVDDEQDSREVLENQIKKYFPGIRILGQAENAEMAFDLANKLKPQLVFLDIQMPMGSGFSFLKKFNEIPFDVIFVTSFDQYAINAIKFSALDYLLKPVETEDLEYAVEKAIKSIVQKKDAGRRIVNLLNNMQGIESEQKIALHKGDNVTMIEVSKIEYIEGDGRYSQIVLDTNDVFASARTLKEFEEYFTENSPFIRISKSLIINSLRIVSYSKGEPCVVSLYTGVSFEVSRRKKQKVLAILKKKGI